MKKNKNFILFVIMLILCITFIISECKNNLSKDHRKSVKTALVNSKYADQINNFIFSKGNESLYLKKEKDLWFVSQTENYNDYIPADTKKVETFINDLIKVINLYKISDTLPEKNDFSLTSDQAFSIIYNNSNQIIFGGYDFLKTSRYLMTGKSTKIYEMDTSLDKYLSISIQNWCEPYIISRQIIPFKTENVQQISVKNQTRNFTITAESENFNETVGALFELRHGGASVLPDNGEVQLSLHLIYGDTSEVFMTIYATNMEGEYNLHTVYKKGYNNYQYECKTKISLWTYNRIKEIIL